MNNQRQNERKRGNESCGYFNNPSRKDFFGPYDGPSKKRYGFFRNEGKPLFFTKKTTTDKENASSQ